MAVYDSALKFPDLMMEYAPMNDAEKREALVLAILSELDKRSLSPIREYDFHQLVRIIQDLSAAFRFIDRPISYSYDLQEFLQRLEQRRLLDDLIIMRDGWVPRHEYQLSRVGHAEAKEKSEAIAESNPALLQRVQTEIHQFAQTYIPPADIKPFWAKHLSGISEQSSKEER